MSRLATGIPVSVEPIRGAAEAWGNCLPILHEIRHGLKRLAETGEPTQVDLSSIPFGPRDEERLIGMLGQGEVEARVEALGPTQVWESAIQGVWLVDYRNIDDQRLAFHVEIATVPEILCSQRQDIQDGITKLETLIESTTVDSDPGPRYQSR